MICNNCGAQVADNSVFCPDCGAAFNVNMMQPAKMEQPMPMQQPAQPVRQQPAQPDFQQGPGFQQGPNFQQAPNFQQGPAFQQAPYQQPVYQNYQQPAFQEQQPRIPSPEAQGIASSALTFGILSLVFTCTFYLAFLGIVFGAIALAKAKAFTVSEGLLYGKAKVGKGLGLGGLIAGIVFTVILCVAVMACTAAIGTARYWY